MFRWKFLIELKWNNVKALTQMKRLNRTTILTAESSKPKYWIFTLEILCCTCHSIWLFCENTIDKIKSLRLFMDEEEASLFWKQLISFCDKLKLLYAFRKSSIAYASFKNICAAWPFSCKDSKGEHAFQWYIFQGTDYFQQWAKMPIYYSHLLPSRY